MATQRICRVCNTAFLGSPDVVGQTLVCPACRTHVSAALQDKRPSDGNLITDALPSERQLDSEGSARAGQLYALGVGLDLNETSEREVMNAAAATRRLQEWQAAMPAVPSAYQPSGALPAPALIAMTLGAIVGVILAAVTVSIAGSAAFVVILLLFAILSGIRSMFISVFAGLLGVIAAVLPFMAGGWVSARLTTLFGRWGKNRNTTAAQILSVVSAGLSVAIVGGLFYVYGSEWLDQWQLIQTARPEFGLLYGSAAVFAALIAMCVAGGVAGKHVQAEKFCESCALFMPPLKVKSLRRGALLAMTRALREQNTEVAVSLLYSEAGQDGVVEVFRCPQCWKGFVEVTAHFAAHWQGEQRKEKKAESWLVASLELPTAEMERFPVYPV